MADLILKEGHFVIYKDKKYSIQSPIDLELIVLEDLKTNEKVTAKIIDLKPFDDEQKNNSDKNIGDLTLISEQDWKEAKYRKEILEPLACKVKCTHEEAKDAAKKLGLSWRQIYNLLKR